MWYTNLLASFSHLYSDEIHWLTFILFPKTSLLYYLIVAVPVHPEDSPIRFLDLSSPPDSSPVGSATVPG